MRNFQQKSKLKRLAESNLALGALGLFVLFFAWSVFGFVGKMKDTAVNKEIARKKVEELREEKEKLTLDLQKLDSEKGVEETIRDKFGLVRPGEDVIVIVDEKKVVEESQQANSSGFFGFFKGLFD